MAIPAVVHFLPAVHMNTDTQTSLNLVRCRYAKVRMHVSVPYIYINTNVHNIVLWPLENRAHTRRKTIVILAYAARSQIISAMWSTRAADYACLRDDGNRTKIHREQRARALPITQDIIVRFDLSLFVYIFVQCERKNESYASPVPPFDVGYSPGVRDGLGFSSCAYYSHLLRVPCISCGSGCMPTTSLQ
jgi:hypothetical protein